VKERVFAIGDEPPLPAPLDALKFDGERFLAGVPGPQRATESHRLLALDRGFRFVLALAHNGGINQCRSASVSKISGLREATCWRCTMPYRHTEQNQRLTPDLRLNMLAGHI
jgi:hypothetical protein